MKSPHFKIEHYERGGKSFTRFTELPRKGHLTRGDQPLVYRYSHSAGNMVMKHPDLWAGREIMALTESGTSHGAVPGVMNDPAFALKTATRHLLKYRGDGMDHSQRMMSKRR